MPTDADEEGSTGDDSQGEKRRRRKQKRDKKERRSKKERREKKERRKRDRGADDSGAEEADEGADCSPTCIVACCCIGVGIWLQVYMKWVRL